MRAGGNGYQMAEDGYQISVISDQEARKSNVAFTGGCLLISDI
jgi:hypothetical protein